jgi:hypothetical protein
MPVGDAKPETKLDNCSAGNGPGVAGGVGTGMVLLLVEFPPHPAAIASPATMAAQPIHFARHTSRGGMEHFDS